MGMHIRYLMTNTFVYKTKLHMYTLYSKRTCTQVGVYCEKLNWNGWNNGRWSHKENY